MSKKSELNESLLREYIRDVLSEDIGDYGGGDGGDSPYGYSWGSNNDLIKTFIEPFTDVFKTFAGKTKELKEKTKTLLSVVVQSALSIVIPGLSRGYAKIFDEEKEALDKIKSEYRDVYERTDAALGGTDASFLAFMASPGLALSYITAKKGPGVAKEILSAATGGLSDDAYDNIKDKAIKAGRWALGEEKDDKKEWSYLNGQVLSEAEAQGDITPDKIIKSKMFMDAALESPKLAKMQKVATQIYRESLQKIYDQAEFVMKKAKTVEDIEKLLKKKIPDLEKIKKLQGEEKAKSEQLLLEGVRKSMKDFYIKSLTEQMQTVLKTGIPENSQYVKDFKDTIQKIKAL